MSACDTCPVPGHCCRHIELNGGSFARECATIDEAEAFARAADVVGPAIPFRPLFKGFAGGWVWWCPNLNQRTGRCDDYENRPLACSTYEPGTDRLCVLHEGPEE